jgi:hypothetical protein
MSGTKRSTHISWLSKCIYFPAITAHSNIPIGNQNVLQMLSSLYWSLAQTQLNKSQIHTTDSSKLLIAPFSDNIHSTEAKAASATQQHRFADLLGKSYNTPKYLSLAQLRLLSPRRMSKREYIVESRSPEQIVPTNLLFYLKDQQIWVLRPTYLGKLALPKQDPITQRNNVIQLSSFALQSLGPSDCTHGGFRCTCVPLQSLQASWGWDHTARTARTYISILAHKLKDL